MSRNTRLNTSTARLAVFLVFAIAYLGKIAYYVASGGSLALGVLALITLVVSVVCLRNYLNKHKD